VIARRRPAPIAAALAALAAAACGEPSRLRAPHQLDGPVRMVISERWSHRSRLVVVDETGDRLAPLLEVVAERDEHPRFSPDGGWLVFTSTRDRQQGTSLWAAPARPVAPAVRLTDDAGVDLDPVWDGGRAVVFASTRGGGLDLFRLELIVDGAGPRPAGPPAQLTHEPGRALSPTVAGERLVFQIVDPGGRGSFVAERRAGGEVVALTDGPADGSPALSPDGTRLAYVTARVRAGGGRDLDVVLAGDPDDPRPPPATGLALEGTDEGSPAWSVDGRWLFATSVAYDADEQPEVASVVHADTWERPPRARMLRDSAGAIPRQGPALAPTILDAAALGRNPDYREALAAARRTLEAERRARDQEAGTGAGAGPDL